MRRVTTREELRRSMPAVIAGIPVAIVFLAVLSIVLTAAGPRGMDLTDRQSSSWIAVLYGLPIIPSLILSIRYRTPMLLTSNIFAIIFFVSLGHRVAFGELTGAAVLAGAIVLVIGLLGMTDRLATWIPHPIVSGLIAGAVLPFLIDVFSSLTTTAGPVEVPIMVGATVLAYLASQLLLGSRVPPILPAFLVGVVVAVVTGQLGPFPDRFELATFAFVQPEFTFTAIATVTPVLVAMMTVQANVPSVIYLRSQGYDPPHRLLDTVSGAGTIAGSFFGAAAVSLALPPLLVTAGPSAGERSLRYRSIFLPCFVGLVIALFAGTATALAVLFPPVLLLTIAGLALVPPLIAALREIVAGPLVVGPLFAFAIALSEMRLFNLEGFFWSLVLGTLVSLVFEREGWRRLRAPTEEVSSP